MPLREAPPTLTVRGRPLGAAATRRRPAIHRAPRRSTVRSPPRSRPAAAASALALLAPCSPAGPPGSAPCASARAP
eukprot:11933-Pleurochrysis_carterae.AAC.1